MRLRNVWLVLLPLAVFACGGSQETSNKSAEPSAPAATPGGMKVDTTVAGTVLYASWLGIYGNCVILDHGMGVQSLYGHLMSFDVKVGDHVTRGQTIGRSDSTGLAGGDHLHFTMLVAGRMVNPVEWWDPHWIADRVERKLKETK